MGKIIFVVILSFLVMLPISAGQRTSPVDVIIVVEAQAEIVMFFVPGTSSCAYWDNGIMYVNFGVSCPTSGVFLNESARITGEFINSTILGQLVFIETIEEIN